jgi:hypothetical protein
VTAFRCPVDDTRVLDDVDAFTDDIPCSACGLLLSLCDGCGKAYAAAQTGIDGMCVPCSEEVWQA